MPSQETLIITAVITLAILSVITIWYVSRKKEANKTLTQHEANHVRIHEYWVAKAAELGLATPKNATTAEIQVIVSTENRRHLLTSSNANRG